GNDAEAAGKHSLGVDLIHPLFYGLNDLLGVAIGDHHDNAADRLGVAALHHGAVPHFFAVAHFADVANVDGSRANFLQYHGSNVLQVFDQADAAYQENFRAARQNASARIRVIASQSLLDVLDRHSVVAHAEGVDQDLILLDVASGGIDFGDAGNGSQQRPRDPVLHDAPFDQFLLGQRALA